VDVLDDEIIVSEVFEDIEQAYGVEMLCEGGSPQIKLVEPIEAVPLRVEEAILVNLAHGKIPIPVSEQRPSGVAGPCPNLENALLMVDEAMECLEDDFHTMREPEVLLLVRVQRVEALCSVVFVVGKDLRIEQQNVVLAFSPI
jgi:hypothetical protein